MGREKWVEVPLCDSCIFNPKHKILDTNINITFVTMADLSEDSPFFKKTKQIPLKEIRKGFTHFQNGDVLFAKITPCMENGKAAIANNISNNIGFGTTELHVLRPMNILLSHYLYHFIHQTKFREEAKQHFTGSVGQQRVPLEFLKNKTIPLPPLNEQKRIVEKLDAILPRVQNAKSRLRKIPVLLKKFRQSVLSSAFSGKLTEDWREGKDLEKWVECNLGDISLYIQRGKSPKYADYSDLPVINQKSIRWDDIYEEHLKYISNDSKNCWPKDRYIKEGDILINSTGTGTIGRACMVKKKHVRKPKVIDSHVTILRLNKQINSHFVFNWIKTKYVQDLITNLYTGSTNQVELNKEKISSIPIPLPPLEEQNEIVRRVEKLFAIADSLEVKYKKALEKIEKLEQSILSKAFRGELVASDPNDPPAEILLEKILEEKKKFETKRKKKNNYG